MSIDLWLKEEVTQYDKYSGYYGSNKIFQTNEDLSNEGFIKIGNLEKSIYDDKNKILISREISDIIENSDIESLIESNIYRIKSEETNRFDTYYIGNEKPNKLNSELIGKVDNLPSLIFRNDFYSEKIFEKENLKIHKTPRIRKFKGFGEFNFVFDKEKCKIIDKELEEIKRKAKSFQDK